MSLGNPMQFAKRYALVDSNEYERVFGNQRTSHRADVERSAAHNLPDPTQDPNVTNARRSQNKLVASLNNPFADTETRLHDHGRLWEQYINDLDRVRETERLKRPVPYTQLRDMTRELIERRDARGDGVTPGRHQASRLPLPTRRMMERSELDRARMDVFTDQGSDHDDELLGTRGRRSRRLPKLPLSIQRVQDHLEPGRTELSSRSRNRQQLADKLLLSSDIVEQGRGRGRGKRRQASKHHSKKRWS